MSVESFRGPIQVIRATADGAKKLGDWEKIGGVYGFWLHDTPDKAVGSFCFKAELVEARRVAANFAKNVRDNDMKAGAVLISNVGGKMETSTGGKIDQGSPGIIGIVYQDSTKDDPVHFILGPH